MPTRKTTSERRRVIAVRLICLAALNAGAAAAQIAPLDSTALNARLRDVQSRIDGTKYAAAESLATGLLQDVEARYGNESAEAGEVLALLVDALWKVGKYLEPATFDLAVRGVAIAEKNFGPEDSRLVIHLNHLGILHRYRGNYAAARPLFERALSIQEKKYGLDNLKVAESLNFLGILLRSQGDYAGARRLLERALAIREKAFGPQHDRVAVSLFNLANVLTDMGDYEAARPLYERGIEMWRTLKGPDHPLMATWLTGLGMLLRETSDPAAAKPLLVQALAIREKASGPDDMYVVESLRNLGSVLADLGDLEGAREKYERALQTGVKVLGPEHPDHISTLRELARLRFSTSDLAGARAFQQRGLEIAEKTLPPTHPEVGYVLSELAVTVAAAGEPVRAIDYALRAEEIGRKHLRLTIRTLSERQALHYASVRATGLDLALSLAAETSVEPRHVSAVWDALIGARALVLDELAARRRAVGAAGDVVRRAEVYAHAQQRLANLLVRGAAGESVEQYQALVADARREAEAAEAALAQISTEFRIDGARQQSGLTEVARALPKGSALVSLIRYVDPRAGFGAGRRHPDGGAAHYLAFVLESPTSDRPIVVGLGSAATVDSLVAAWRAELTRPAPGADTKAAEAQFRIVGGVLARTLWSPIEPHLRAANRIFVVPDAALQLVSLAALPRDDNEYIVEHGPQIHYLSTERDLIRPPAGAAQGRGLLVLGDPDYESAAPTPVADRRAAAATSATPSAVFRGDRSTCGEFAKLHWARLPETAREVREAVDIWSSTLRDQTELLGFTRENATESAFKRYAPGRRVVHLATHGFFIDEQCVSASERQRGVALVDRPAGQAPAVGSVESPLVLAGLVLAGANRRDGGQDEDGILTAEEIGALDLHGVEWAVLSACETGVGQVRGSEGVFGLRRAFQVAGVGTLIMSLWSVEDEAAREWMSALYAARLEKDLGTMASVHQATLAVLRHRRSRGLDSHPFYWAAFVAAGDWR